MRERAREREQHNLLHCVNLLLSAQATQLCAWHSHVLMMHGSDYCERDEKAEVHVDITHREKCCAISLVCVYMH
jgi:hypothetical protein